MANKKVIMLTSISGPEGAWGPGEIYTCDAAVAKKLISQGLAEPVTPTTKRKASGEGGGDDGVHNSR